GGGARAACEDPAAGALLVGLVADERWVDAHTLAGVLVALCPQAPGADEWRILDAIALERLDEPERARELLAGVRVPRARALLARSDWRGGHARRSRATPLAPDAAARLTTLASVGAEPSFRAASEALDEALRQRVRRAHADYQAARSRSPALAGVLSALLPGA